MSHYPNSNPDSLVAPKKLKLRIFNTIQNKTSEVLVYPWMTVAELKNKIERDIGMPYAQQRLFLKTQELTKNNDALLSYGISRNTKVSLRAPPNLKSNTGIIRRYESLPKDENLKKIIRGISEGFGLGLIPKSTLEGTSGVYFLRNGFRKNVGIFKPFDEEPFAPNNPKGYQGKLGSQGFRRGVLSGEAAAREVAAYLLDDRGFFNVPPTTYVEVVHPFFGNKEITKDDVEENFQDLVPSIINSSDLVIKHGSLQAFVENAEEASDYSYSCFSDEEVHKIAILDILILNCDRNEGNILIKKLSGKQFRLIPIDHGLSFPDTIDICSYEVVWTDWPQIHRPFSEQELALIQTLTPRESALKLAKGLRFRDICLRNFRISATLLMKFAKAELTIADIAALIYKDDPDLTAPIEELITKTENITKTMRESISPAFLKDLTKTDKKIKMTKYFTSEIIQEERKEKETKDKRAMLNNITAKVVSRPRILSDIVEECSPYDPNGLNLDAPPPMLKAKSTMDPVLILNTTVSRESTDGSKNDFGSEDLDDDPEEFDNGEFQTPVVSKRKLLHSLCISRNISLPHLKKAEEEKSKEEEEEKIKEKEDMDAKARLESASKKRRQIIKKNKKTTPAYIDDLFFYYFETFLDQKIEAIKKQKMMTTGRGRFMSEG